LSICSYQIVKQKPIIWMLMELFFDQSVKLEHTCLIYCLVFRKQNPTIRFCAYLALLFEEEFSSSLTIFLIVHLKKLNHIFPFTFHDFSLTVFLSRGCYCFHVSSLKLQYLLECYEIDSKFPSWYLQVVMSSKM
jgi:hypothetical protein